MLTLVGCCSDNTLSHDWISGELDNGFRYYTCNSCAMTKRVYKKWLYRWSCNNIAKSMYGLSPRSTTAKTDITDITAVSVDPTIYIEADESDYSHVYEAALYVELLSALIGNSDFEVTSSPVSFTFSYLPLGYQCNVTLMYDFDEENNKVTMYWDVFEFDTDSQSESKIFLYLSVNYDFDSRKVRAFEVYSLHDYTDKCKPVGWRYEDNKLLVLDSNADVSSFKEKTYSLIEELNSYSQQLVKLDADFTDEYTKMMNKLNPHLAE